MDLEELNFQQELSRIEQATDLRQQRKTCNDERSNDMAKKVAAKTESKAKGFSGADLAKELGISTTRLRVHLRDIKAKKPGGRWEWPSKSDDGLEAIRKKLKEAMAGSKSNGGKPAKKAVAKKAVKKATPKKSTATKAASSSSAGAAA